MKLTEADILAWGSKEHKQRMDDIAAMKRGEVTLDEVQRRARKRMRESGMTRAVAHRAIRDGSRPSRRALEQSQSQEGK